MAFIIMSIPLYYQNFYPEKFQKKKGQIISKHAGIYVNNLSGKMTYKSFKPSFLPHSINMSDEIITSLVEANKELSLLEGLSKRIPDINLFVSYSSKQKQHS